MRLIASLAAARIRLIVDSVFTFALAASLVIPYFIIKSEKERFNTEINRRTPAIIASAKKYFESRAGDIVLFNPFRANSPEKSLHLVSLPVTRASGLSLKEALMLVEGTACFVRYFREEPEIASNIAKASICAWVANDSRNDLKGSIFITGSLLSHSITPFEERPAGVARAQVDARRIAQDRSEAHRLHLTLRHGDERQWVIPLEAVISRERTRIERLTGKAYAADGYGTADYERVAFDSIAIEEDSCLSGSQDEIGCLRQLNFFIEIPWEAWNRIRKEAPGSVSPNDILAHVELHGLGAFNAAHVLFSTRAPQEAKYDSDTGSDWDRYNTRGEHFTVGKLKSNETYIENLRFRPQPIELSRWESFLLAFWNEIEVEGRSIIEDGTLSRFRQFLVSHRNEDFVITINSDAIVPDIALLNSTAALIVYSAIMLLITVTAWLTIRVGVVRRITTLARRTRTISEVLREDGGPHRNDLTSLRGRDEIGTLAADIDDMVNRISADVQRENARLLHHESVLRAVGHEIRSPLQALSALADDKGEAAGYMRRMLRAIHTLYGDASPKSSLEAVGFDIEDVDLVGFLESVARNAPLAGIEDVVFRFEGQSPVVARIDTAGLAQVLDHILNNAVRYRAIGSPIAIGLQASKKITRIAVYNEGPKIDEERLEKIFDYGETDSGAKRADGLGQGLFVARTFMTKMGGKVYALNRPGGVEFVIELLPTELGR